MVAIAALLDALVLLVLVLISCVLDLSPGAVGVGYGAGWGAGQDARLGVGAGVGEVGANELVFAGIGEVAIGGALVACVVAQYLHDNVLTCGPVW